MTFKENFKKISTAVLICFTLLFSVIGGAFVTPVLSAAVPCKINSEGKPIPTDPAGCVVDATNSPLGSKTVSDTNIQNTLVGFANVLIGLVAVVSVFFIIWGAIQWMNEGAEKGQKTVVNAVIGLVIAVLAFFIVQLATGAAGFLQTQVK